MTSYPVPTSNGVNGCTVALAASGRDHLGRFVRGNRGGPGNPHARRTADLRRAFFDAVTAADLRAIARQMVKQAKSGDVIAAKLVLGYAIGRPVVGTVGAQVDAELSDRLALDGLTDEDLSKLADIMSKADPNNGNGEMMSGAALLAVETTIVVNDE